MKRFHFPRLAGFLLALTISAGLVFAPPVMAQTVDFEAFATAAGFSTDADVTVIIARLIRTAISLVGVIAVVLIIIGGFKFITAAGDPTKVQSAKRTIMNAVIGLVIVFASFAITQFILNALVDATGGTVTGTSSSYTSTSTSSTTSSQFYLSSLNNECSEALKNLQLQFVFSRSVDASSTALGILVQDDGADVDGTFDISGRSVTFTPNQVCPEDSSQYCFDASTDYTVDVVSGVLVSTSGADLVCTDAYPCNFSFTTGTEIDTEGPTMEIDDPEDGDSVYQDGDPTKLWANTTDDTGVSTVDFYVVTGDSAIYTAGTDFSTEGVLTGGDAVNTFFTDDAEEWDTTGYVTNQEYRIWGKAYDCAGNTATAGRIEIVLRAANCNNATIDTELGEEELNCGGDSDSEYYCGACAGAACEEDSDCSSGECVDGVCVDRVKITDMSPGDGAEGNLVTIEGASFGSTPGTVTFLGGDGDDDDVDTSAYTCNAEVQWSDTEIIVEIPTGAVDGYIAVTTADGDTDTTNDDYGPNMAEFDVNAIVRSGICQLSPDSGEPETSVGVYGIGFGSSQGTSEFLFGSYTPGTYISWADEEYIEVSVPNVNSGVYKGQVITGDYVCIDSGGTSTGVTCSEDSDCNTDGGESCATGWCSETLHYCEEDDDCGDDDGTCESIIVGSNRVSYTIEDIDADVTPVISSIDSGWTACEGGFNAGDRCSDDDDCGAGTCEDAGDTGPPGQYITIYGTGFGTTEGLVWFENQDSGVYALGDTEFPDVCGDDFWHSTSITVKVPEEYNTDSPTAVDFDEYNLTVERPDGGESDAVDFEILDDTPGPSACRITPSAGPAGTSVTIYGENFGDSGDVEFYSEETASVGDWDNDELSYVIVPSAALTGPVAATEDTSGYSSNSLNFSVGDCREDATLCSEAEACCADGSCSSSCPASTEVSSHYAYKISTGITPLVPEVVIQCSDSAKSPSPWEGWSDPEDICIDANIRADFTLAIDPTTLNGSTVVVERCDTEDGEGGCTEAGWSTVDSTDFSFVRTDTTVILQPVSFLAQDTLYQVTLDGDGTLPDIQATAAAGGGYLDGNFSWQFRTRESTDQCEVGDVLITPNEHTATEVGTISYYASLVAAGDSCVTISCSGYELEWDADSSAATIPTEEPGVGICDNTVVAVSETPAETPVIISAEVDAEGTPSGDGDLYINFVDPEVEDYFPDCSTACINALPYAEFNVAMDDSFTYGASGNIRMAECPDSLCHIDEIDYDAVDFVSSASYSDTTHILSIVFNYEETMEANTWYRVWIDGEVESATGVALEESGSNYGTEANLYFEDDFSWKFKTKDSDVTCDIDSVSVNPSLINMSYIGERAEFDATAVGEPDDCSASGQALQAGDYTWDAWTATDNPDTITPASGTSTTQENIVAYMVADGAIDLTDEIPAYCTTSCLYAGAPVTEFDAVCGDNSVDTGEDCDDGNDANGDGCSSTCLYETDEVSQCAQECSGSGATCTSDSSCEETCESATCSSASDVGNACTADEDCDSGSCGDEATCEDYEDADNECSSNDACSGSCVGECSLTGSSCSGPDTDCSYSSGDTCDITGIGCCGDGTLNAGNFEECDDGNLSSGDGCSSSCQNEGSSSVGAACGDGSRDYNPSQGGEDCDDGNNVSGDGCSRQCLNEGSTSDEDAYSSCGDGFIGLGEECDDGTTDGLDGVMEDGDGCSVACLNEGSLSIGATCGNGSRDYTPIEGGEDCDDGNTENGDGCSSDCLNEGASYNNTIISFCGDGDITWLEARGGEECDAPTTATYVNGDYAVSVVATGAPMEVDSATSLATSDISVTAEDETGTANLQLECSCTMDYMCSTDGSLGCGDSGCCVPRPEYGTINPADNTSAPGDGHCRNTAVWVEFTEDMNELTFDESVDENDDGVISDDEFDANLYLDLVELEGSEVTSATCPTDDGYVGVSFAMEDQPILVRAWSWLKRTVLGFFGRTAVASDAYGCYVPVTYETMRVDSDGDSAIDSMRVYLRYSTLLEEDAEYRLVMLGDDEDEDTLHEGLISAYGGALCIGTACSDDEATQSFYVGEEICELDEVVTEDQGDITAASYEDASSGLFTSADEVHQFLATPYTIRSSGVREEITELPLAYEWEWSWISTSTSNTPTDDDVVEVVADVDAVTAQFQSAGLNGVDVALATATITTDELFETSTAGSTVTGPEDVTALLCENVWPATDSSLGFPYVEDDLPSYFSFYYCRDAGEEGTDDDLPALNDPIEVASLSSSGITKELIFQVDGTSDAIGVRVIPNEEYLSPSAWVEEQGFTGSFTETTLDGYQAVMAGTTYYVAAANEYQSTLYPNIYVISYNEDAGDEASEIFALIMDTFVFNANDDDVEDVALCRYGSSDYTTDEDGSYISCEYESDCYEACEDGSCSHDAEDIDCVNDKGKLTRDMKRLTDVTDMIAVIDAYGEDNMHCSVTKGQSCDEDDDCPGTEECLEGYPEIQTGTFIPSLTNSIWGSWNSELSNALGSTLPTDPINEFFQCDEEGYDEASCWNGESGTFMCPDDSHLYSYQSVGGEAYMLYAQLEIAGERTWAYDIDMSSTDNVTVTVEYPYRHAPSSSLTIQDGFDRTADFCDGDAIGEDVICGDGIQGVGEACELGDTDVELCDYDGDGTADDGQVTVSCYKDSTDQCVMQTASEAETEGAECFPFECGNGVIDGDEECDDGSLNGTYGFCGDDCTYDDAYYCGDGYLAGGEECDCGTTSNFSTLASDTWAVAVGTCDVSNGQYSSDIDLSCAYNCTAPGLACGDEVVNGSEECDGDYEEYAGALCDDGSGTECVSDDDCDSGVTCGGSATYDACGIGDVCADYEDAGDACTDGTDCDSGSCTNDTCDGASDVGVACDSTSTLGTYIYSSGVCESHTCPDFDYELFRYRTCAGPTDSNACEWNTWQDCVGGTQQCGNGEVEGTEACDDGNGSNNDECTNNCELNVCGDDHVNVGVESCDDGDDNGEECEAGYESSCTYCTTTCQYQVRSGGYCGDQEVNGNEVCDGAYSTEFMYYDAGVREISGTCDEYDVDTKTVSDLDDDGVDETFSCRWIGVCNGGSENGDYCTLDYASYVVLGTIGDLNSGSDRNSCGSDGECVPPVCAGDCGSSCPISFETTSLLVQSELEGAEPTGSIDLYSYQNDEGASPDNGVIYVPACTVATSLVADIDDEEVVLPDVDIVFVTDLSGSMDWDPDRNDYCEGGSNDGDSCSAHSECGSTTYSCSSGYCTGGIFNGDECSSSADCPEYACSEYGAPVGERRIDFVVDATKDAIQDLYDAYDLSSAEMQVGLVSYSTNFESSASAFCDYGGSTAPSRDGAWMDTYSDDGVGLLSDSWENSVVAYVDAYTACVERGSGGTTTYSGVDRALTGLSASTADVKIVVLLSDGDPSYSADFYLSGDGDTCTEETSSYQGSWTGVEACVADIADDFMEDNSYSDIIFYSAAVTTDDDLKGYMAHMSSNECAWDDIEDEDDCEGNYAFAAETADEITEMYAAIVNSILGTNVALSAENNDNEIITTIGEVLPGGSTTLPFPDEFVCQSSEQTLPLRHEFYGSGYMTFDDITLTYCPYE